jgi:ATP-binding protein involved in chromosome partitioning
MFRNLRVPVLGIVENMSYFECPDCGSRHNIFSHGGGEAASSSLNVPFLGEVPLNQRVRESGDEGLPLPVAAPDDPAAAAFSQIARKLAAQVSVRSALSIPLAVR